VADFHLKSLASGLSPVGSKATFEEGPVLAQSGHLAKYRRRLSADSVEKVFFA
jgi:hypothetical protein